jgi:GLPGLI family protein
MKILVLAAVLFTSFLSIAQQSEGYIQYSIDVKALDTSIEVRQQVSMLMDSKMEIFFAENLSRVDFKMGKMYTTSFRINRNTGFALATTSGIGGQLAQPMTVAQVDAAPQSYDSTGTVELVAGERTILGYKCKKAILTSSSGQKTIYWYTEDIMVEVKGLTLLNPLVPGFPLAFSSTENGLSMNFEASNIEKTVEDKEEAFSLIIPEGFKVMPNQPQ